MTHSCFGLHSQPFFSSARRHSDLLVHLQRNNEQLSFRRNVMLMNRNRPPAGRGPTPLQAKPEQKVKIVSDLKGLDFPLNSELRIFVAFLRFKGAFKERLIK